MVRVYEITWLSKVSHGTQDGGVGFAMFKHLPVSVRGGAHAMIVRRGRGDREEA